MGVVTFTEDIASPVPALRLFKALILDADNLIPKIVPQAIRSIETIQGDGGPGSIKQMNFAEGSPFKCLKHRIDALDEKNMTYAYTLIEGDALMDKLEFISYEMKLESDANGGCVGKNISKYHAKPGVEIKEEEIKAGKEKARLLKPTSWQTPMPMFNHPPLMKQSLAYHSLFHFYLNY